MDRRAFLVGSACGVGGAAVAWPAHGFASERDSHVLRLDPDGDVWRPFKAETFAQPAAAGTQRLRLLGPRLATGSSLHSLELDLLFETGATAPARHRAWRFASACVEGNSGDSSIVLPAQGVRLAFRLSQGVALQPVHLRVDAGRWPEGDYLIRVDAAATAALSCGPSGACAPPPGVDGFLLQVHHEQAAPDLCLRADLACLVQGPESV